MQGVREVVVQVAIRGVAVDGHQQLGRCHARDGIAADTHAGAARRGTQRIGDRLAGGVEGHAAGGAGVAKHAADWRCGRCAVVDVVDHAARVGLEAAADVRADQVRLPGHGTDTGVRDDLAAMAPRTRKAIADAVRLIVFAAQDEVALAAAEVVAACQ